MLDRDGVFDEFAACLQFPHYFGRNWNAFIDCVQDLEWLPSSAFVLIIRDARRLLENGDPDELALFSRILVESEESLAQSNEFRRERALHAVLHVLPGEIDALDSRLRDVGVFVSSLEI